MVPAFHRLNADALCSHGRLALPTSPTAAPPRGRRLAAGYLRPAAARTARAQPRVARQRPRRPPRPEWPCPGRPTPTLPRGQVPATAQPAPTAIGGFRLTAAPTPPPEAQPAANFRSRRPARCRSNSQLAIFQSLAPPTRASTIPTRLKMIDKLRAQPSLAHLWFRECWGKAGYITKVPLNALRFG